MNPIIPEVKILKISGIGKGTKYYVIRCPYCETLHHHAVRGGLGNRGAHCLDARFMKEKPRKRFIKNKEKYGGCGTYDIVLE